MKVKTTIKYYEGYLPTKRHRKLRYREIQEKVYLDVNSVYKKDAPIAFIVKNGREDDVELRLWKNELWKPTLYSEKISGAKGLFPLEEFVKSIDYCDGYSHPNKEEFNRTVAIKAKKEYINRYLVIDGVVYAKTGEPRYVLMTFGLGHNHGGTSLMIDYSYNPNINKDCYFTALERKEAVKTARETALKRSDTDSIDRIGKYYNIKVLIPEAVKCNPQEEHGEGDPLINEINNIAENTSNPFEAGLLVTAYALSKLS